MCRARTRSADVRTTPTITTDSPVVWDFLVNHIPSLYARGMCLPVTKQRNRQSLMNIHNAEASVVVGDQLILLGEAEMISAPDIKFSPVLEFPYTVTEHGTVVAPTPRRSVELTVYDTAQEFNDCVAWSVDDVRVIDDPDKYPIGVDGDGVLEVNMDTVAYGRHPVDAYVWVMNVLLSVVCTRTKKDFVTTMASAWGLPQIGDIDKLVGALMF